MDAAARSRMKLPKPTFAELFTPKLVTILRAGYRIRRRQGRRRQQLAKLGGSSSDGRDFRGDSITFRK